MEGPPTLNTLPVELIAAVGEHVEGQDLLSLRFTCREVCAATTDVFLNGHFKERSHIFTRHGLRSLIDITAVPHLARKIQHVNIVVAALSLSYAPQHRARERSTWQNRKGSDHGIIAGETHGNGIADGDDDDDQVWRRWLAEKESVSGSSDAAELLTRTLHNLEANGTVLKITVSEHARSFDFDIAEPYGAATLRRKLGGVKDLQCDDCATAVEAVLKAIPMAACKVDTLNLSYGDVNHSMQSLTRGALAQSVDQRLSMWACLKHLQLDFITAAFWNEADFENFGSFISPMVNLESFDIFWEVIPVEGWEQRQFLTHLGDRLKGHALRSVTFRCTHVTLADLQAFLSSQRHSLRSVAMLSLAMPWNECWSSLLKWMAEQLRLTTVDLDHLERKPYMSFGDYVFGEDGRVTHLLLQGADVVKSGLLEAAAGPTYINGEGDEE